MKKNIVSLMGALIMLLGILSLTVTAASPKMIVNVIPDKTEVYPGEIVTFTVTISADFDCPTICFILDIPDGMSYVDGSGAVDQNLKSNTGADGDVAFEESLLMFTCAKSEPLTINDNLVFGSFVCVVDENASGSFTVGLTEVEITEYPEYNALSEDEYLINAISVFSSTGHTHDWAVQWSKNETYHWYDCSDCSEEKDKATHIGGIATCKNQGVCTVCGYAYLDKNPNNHVDGTEIRDAKTSTCNEEGYTGDTYCLGCNKKIQSGTSISATGNHVDADNKWEFNAKKHWHTCGCGTTIDFGVHKDDTGDGLCDICGYWEEKPETEAPAKPDIPADEVVNLFGYGELIASSDKDISSAFDGDLTTGASVGGGGEGYWLGIKLAEPTILSHVSLATPDTDGDGKTNRPHTIFWTVVEGSNDGVTWHSIMKFGDPYYEFEEYVFDYENGISDYWTEYAFDGESIEDDDAVEPVAYTYYRVWNADDNDNWGEIEFWGSAYVEAPETEAPALDAEITISVYIQSTEYANSFAFTDLEYDTELLEYVGFGKVEENDLINKNVFNGAEGAIDKENNTVIFALENPEILSGKICSLVFKVKGNNLKASENAADEVNFNIIIVKNGSYIVDGYEIITQKIVVNNTSTSDYINGDINGDRIIDIVDALQMFQHCMLPNVYPISYPGNLDFTMDNKVDIEDVLLLFRHSLLPNLYPLMG